MRTTMLLLLITMLTVPARASNRMLITQFEVNAPIEKVWDARTTPGGSRPSSRLIAKSICAWTVPTRSISCLRPSRERGGEGMRILGLEPMRRFAFTWGARRPR